MGNLRALSIALLAFTAACGDDGAATADALIIIDAAPDAPSIDAPPDAPSYDFSCYENDAPTVIATTVALSGTASEVIVNGITPSIQDAADVAISACVDNCNGPNELDTTTSDASGNFATAAIPTNGAAVDGYLRATKTGNRTTYIYPASPIAADQTGVPMLMLTPGAVQAIGFIGTPQDAANAIVGVLVTDCATPPAPITGATITVTQGGTAVGDAPLDLSALAAQGAGAFLVTNVPVNADTVVSATYDNMTFRAHSVATVAGTTTMTQVKPGF